MITRHTCTPAQLYMHLTSHVFLPKTNVRFYKTTLVAHNDHDIGGPTVRAFNLEHSDMIAYRYTVGFPGLVGGLFEFRP